MYILANNGGIQAVVNAIKNLIEFIQTILTFIANIFRSMILAFNMLLQMIPKVMTLIATLPSWLITFATITIGVTVAYFIMGRQAGKSD